MNIIKKSNINLPTIIFSIYLALSLYRFAFPSLEITLAIILIALIPFLLFISNNYRFSKYIYGLFFLLLISYIFSCILVDRYEAMPRNILHLMDCFAIALLILSGKVRSWGGYLVFYILFFYFLTFILRGIPVQDVLDYSSWNGISMLIIVSCISVYIINSLQNKKIDLIPAALALFISFWGMGRSGVLSCSILLFGLVILEFKSFKSLIRPRAILFSILFLGLFLYLSSDYIINSFIITIGILNRETSDISSGRFEIWNNYYNNLDIFRLLFGSNIFTDPWPKGEELAYNLHNSFLRLFSYTGLMGLLVIGLMIAALIYFFRKNKLFFILFLVLIIRGFTDIIFFFESWDFLPLFFIFYYLKTWGVSGAKNPSTCGLSGKLTP
jgi:hypothetical protein